MRDTVVSRRKTKAGTCTWIPSRSTRDSTSVTRVIPMDTRISLAWSTWARLTLRAARFWVSLQAFPQQTRSDIALFSHDGLTGGFFATCTLHSYTKVHAEDGSRIGCGILEAVDQSDANILSAETEALSDSGVTSSVLVYSIKETKVCFFGSARGLETNLLSFLDGGVDCQETNGTFQISLLLGGVHAQSMGLTIFFFLVVVAWITGCGAHIHAGVDWSQSILGFWLVIFRQTPAALHTLEIASRRV